MDLFDKHKLRSFFRIGMMFPALVAVSVPSFANAWIKESLIIGGTVLSIVQSHTSAQARAEAARAEAARYQIILNKLEEITVSIENVNTVLNEVAGSVKTLEIRIIDRARVTDLSDQIDEVIIHEVDLNDPALSDDDKQHAIRSLRSLENEIEASINYFKKRAKEGNSASVAYVALGQEAYVNSALVRVAASADFPSQRQIIQKLLEKLSNGLDCEEVIDDGGQVDGGLRLKCYSIDRPNRKAGKVDRLRPLKNFLARQIEFWEELAGQESPLARNWSNWPEQLGDGSRALFATNDDLQRAILTRGIRDACAAQRDAELRSGSEERSAFEERLIVDGCVIDRLSAADSDEDADRQLKLQAKIEAEIDDRSFLVNPGHAASAASGGMDASFSNGMQSYHLLNYGVSGVYRGKTYTPNDDCVDVVFGESEERVDIDFVTGIEYPPYYVLYVEGIIRYRTIVKDAKLRTQPVPNSSMVTVYNSATLTPSIFDVVFESWSDPVEVSRIDDLIDDSCPQTRFLPVETLPEDPHVFLTQAEQRQYEEVISELDELVFIPSVSSERTIGRYDEDIVNALKTGVPVGDTYPDEYIHYLLQFMQSAAAIEAATIASANTSLLLERLNVEITY